MAKIISSKKRKKRNKTKYTAFFAYPSQDKTQSEIIEEAIKIVNKQSDIFIKSWQNLKGKNSRIITNILDEMSKNDFLIADISNLNQNVIFELGYAFGKRKNILLFTQGYSNANREKDLNDLPIISQFNILSFENKEELSTLIIENNPISLNSSPEIDTYGIDNKNLSESYGLCLKGNTNHEFAINALTTFKSCFNQTLVDDWSEDGSQTLTWYVRSVQRSKGICAFFVPDKWDNSRQVNSRFAFVCGMALALKKQVLMIGLSNYSTPFDYRELLKIPNNISYVKQIVKNEFGSKEEVPNEPTVIKMLHETKDENQKLINLTTQDKELILLDVHIGDTIAENEESQLSEYFVETGQYYNAISTKQSVVVGSKGTGKTAMFYQIRNHFLQNKKVIVCDIKPDGYKISRFISSLKRLSDPNSMTTHITESAWKLVIFTYLFSILRDEIKKIPIYIGLDQSQNNLLDFVEEYKFIIDVPFEQKLDIVIKWLEEENYDSDNFTKKIHEKFINGAKKILSEVLKSKEKIIILIDNLDKDWMVGNDLILQSQMVFSILGLHKKLEKELNFVVDINLNVFLRRNIFEFILQNSREPDKLITDSLELSWNDQTMLLRVIDERFKKAFERNSSKISDPWKIFFIENIDGVLTKHWIFKNVLPRPRDLIHFLLRAIEFAINRNHSKILKDDLLDALKNHSSFALDQIIAEYQAEEPWLPLVLHSFMGTYNEWTYSNLYDHISKLNLEIFNDKSIGQIIASLVAVRFIGIKLPSGEIRFSSYIQESITLTDKVKNHPSSEPLDLIIHPVFNHNLGLEIGKSDPFKRKVSFLSSVKSLFKNF